MNEERNETQKTVPCSCCGRPLYAADDLRDGEDAWYICDNWYCNDCARSEFLREVTAWE